MKRSNPSQSTRDTETDTDLLILGGRIGANLTAAYIARKHPDLRITIVGRTDTDLPVVGESLTEAPTLFMHECGLASLLEEQHFHKYGLTFYFKTRIDEPTDSTYSIHEEPAIPPLPANLINRVAFDAGLRVHNRKQGVTLIEGLATEVSIQRGAHRATIETADGRTQRISARWIVDATGRSRVLCKKFGLMEKPRWQRSTFWFRLADFDESILFRLIDEMRRTYPQMAEQIAYDSYYVTHHFMGRGNWIWLIPITDDSGRKLISIGITYRPDVYPTTIRTMEDFLENVAREHPVVAEFVRSGTVVDTNKYLNYLYHTSRHYSADGWFIVGDAANAVDPLYSTGILLQTTEIMQISEMIRRDRAGQLDDASVEVFDSLYTALFHRAQNLVGGMYDVMHDPYQSHLRMHWTTAIYFYVVLPWFMSNYHTDLAGAKLFRRMIEDSVADDAATFRLFADASEALGPVTPDHLVNFYDRTINYRLFTPRESELPLHLGRYALLTAQIRLHALRHARGRGMRMQLPLLARDLARGALLRTALRGRSLRASRVFHRLMNAPAPAPHELEHAPRPMLDGSLPERAFGRAPAREARGGAGGDPPRRYTNGEGTSNGRASREQRS
ncbi:MAG: tryptophan 7-halogenase [Kofleriaceae bacterium]